MIIYQEKLNEFVNNEEFGKYNFICLDKIFEIKWMWNDNVFSRCDSYRVFLPLSSD